MNVKDLFVHLGSYCSSILHFLLIYEYYWLAWEWIVKTTHCLLKSNLESLFVIINLFASNVKY